MRAIAIAGRVGRDGELKDAGGTKVLKFSVATNSRKKDDDAVWFDVDVWGTRGEVLAPMIGKGREIAVSGELSTREHNGKTYLSIRADQVTLVGPRPDAAEHRQPSPRPDPGGRSDLDDDLPF